jgi:hypothetical protein
MAFNIGKLQCDLIAVERFVLMGGPPGAKEQVKLQLTGLAAFLAACKMREEEIEAALNWRRSEGRR